MTVRDHEVVELLRGEPELLALADAVHATQQLPRRRRLSGPAPRAAAVVAIAVGVIVAVLFVPDRVARPGVIGRALAAIGNGRVLHLRTETPSGLVYVDLKTGHRTIVVMRNEVWFDRDTKRFHYLMESQGNVADIVWPDDRKPGTTVQEGQIDPAFAALWGGYREALASGDAKLERKDVLDGRPVYWLRFRSSVPDAPGTEVAIDRSTYKPVLFREHYPNGHQIDERVLVAETIGFRPEDFKRRGGDLLGDYGTGSGYSMDSPPAKPVVKPPWLTAGANVIGLPLAAVNAATTTRQGGPTSHGIVLLYGDVKRAESAELTIEEYRSVDDPASFKAIPLGAVAIQTDEVSSGKKHTTQWTGSLARDGIYATIETTRGEQALLEVARALHRAG